VKSHQIKEREVAAILKGIGAKHKKRNKTGWIAGKLKSPRGGKRNQGRGGTEKGVWRGAHGILFARSEEVQGGVK